MADVKELLYTTCQTARQFSVCLWDYNTTNTIQTYRNGGTVTSKTLAKVGHDYIVAAEQQKPLLHVWAVNSQEQMKSVRLVLPEPATSLAVCPNNCYLAVATGSKLNIWQLNSGKLLVVQQKHFQPISVVKFSSDGDYLVTAGKDGMLFMYNFGSLINLQNNHLPQKEVGQVEPLYKRMDHGAAITDIHIGNFGFKSRLATVSVDRLCILYNLLEGEPILRLVFDDILTSVLFDAACWQLFVGTNKGLIQQFDLMKPPRSLEFHITDDCKAKNSFAGHEKKINCLDLNITNDILASGSDDFKVFIWEVKSRSHLHTIEHTSAITNVLFTLSHVNMTAQQLKPQVVLKSLQRNLDKTDHDCCVNQFEDIVFSDEEEGTSGKEGNSSLQVEYRRAKVVNHQLFQKLMEITKEMHNVK